MPRVFTVSDSVFIEAGPAEVYRQLSQPARMGRWSPENLGATVRGGEQAARVGLVFDGHNRRGAFRWTTRCTVTAAEQDRLFRFRVHAIGLRRPTLRAAIATWEYRLTPADSGTEVTETWTDDRRSWPDPVANLFDRVVTRGLPFADFQRRNIRTTLRNLKTALESPDGAQG
ncbi:SRPBCC family protein [Streptomyces sp. ODS05-4]|uniref:SRPBCC family protein n=1 Tax=Streptomyces sp. ODS05-4 TaxID=2944939 RepID=UPI00210AB76C|nr:SRPBCC family protein [Streptomyces sp. ODS05-4]